MSRKDSFQMRVLCWFRHAWGPWLEVYARAREVSVCCRCGAERRRFLNMEEAFRARREEYVNDVWEAIRED